MKGHRTKRRLTASPRHAVYSNGEVCISILHTPGDDPLHYEKASERWSPVQGVRSVLMSVLSMLAEPNVESGANIEVGRASCGDLTVWNDKADTKLDVMIVLQGLQGRHAVV